MPPAPRPYVLSLARIFKPALLSAYREYEQLADDLSDGPILRDLRTAIVEKMEQVAALTSIATAMMQAAPERSAKPKHGSLPWASA